MQKSKKTKIDWFKDRGYLHLTNRINLKDKKKVYQYVSNPLRVKKHRFLPLILKQTNTRRFKFSDNLNKRSHKTVDDKGNISSNTKMRPIMYSTHIDSHIYSYYSQKILQLKYEDYLKSDIKLDKCITAYRQIESDDGLRYKYNVDFAKEVFEEIKQRKNCAVLTFDIENFFPSLNHNQLKKSWSSLLGKKSLPKDHYAVFKSITNFSYFYYNDLRQRHKGNLDEKKISKLKNSGKYQFFDNYLDFQNSKIQVYKNQSLSEGKVAGIPQGLPISAMLANLYMLPFDENVITKLVNSKNCYYRRYSDDLVVVCESTDVDEVEEIISKEIEKLKLKFYIVNERLECSKVKNNQLIPNSYLQYLGFDFYGYKTLIKSANVSRFYREMKESILMKAKRIESVQKKCLSDESIIFKRKIYRLYSFKGFKSRYLPAKKIILQNGKQVKKEYKRKYRGNFIKYAYRASDLMEAPEIRRQLRRHMIILNIYISKFKFDNTSNL